MLDAAAMIVAADVSEAIEEQQTTLARAPDPTVPPPPPLTSPEQLRSWTSAGHFSKHFAAEPMDYAWASDSEAALQQAIAALDLAYTAMLIHCRSTMCRIEVAANIESRDDDGVPFHTIILDEAIKPFMRENTRISAASGGVFGYSLSVAPQGTPSNPGNDHTRIWLGYLYQRETLPPQPVPEAVQREIEEFRARERSIRESREP